MLKTFFISLFIALNASASVDTAKSTLNWKGTKKIGDKHEGTLKISAATVNKDKAGSVVGGEFVVDMESIDVSDLSGNYKTKFLNHMKSDDFFDVKKHPTSKLKINKISADGKATGELTLKGKTEPVEISFTKSDKTYTGTFVFDRTRWGVVYGAGNIFKELAADKIIDNEIRVEFKIITQ